jgi:spermidine synthase
MKNNRWIYLNLFFLSASVLCFEIISTRISSVIFANDYAFIILSLAVLGLGSGGVFSYYSIRARDGDILLRIVFRSLFFLGITLCLFIISVIEISITNPFIYFFLLFLPFFLAGIAYAQLYKMYSEQSFKLYASDLSGAAAGSVCSLGLFGIFGGPNSILFIALIVFGLTVNFMGGQFSERKRYSMYSVVFLSFVALLYNGKNEFLGRVPIGNYLEKDFYHVYPDPTVRSQIIDSRWSIYGRSDLVRYSHQDVVQQLFIDGAAGTQMYRFDGNVAKTNPLLLELLLHHSSAIPFLFLKEDERRKMLVIGPGGGKEVLIGLFSGVAEITAVEINPDFVAVVKDHKNFNGGIYSDFPNVKVIVQEGRHYVEQSKENFDLIVMALPSTEQTQSIEPFAMSENYLLTVEAIRDYLNILTPEGRLILTVHNRLELLRLIVTTVSAFDEMGIQRNDVQNHFAVLESKYAPTIVIKKTAFSKEEVSRWHSVIGTLPRDFPAVTYLPYGGENSTQTGVNRFLSGIVQDRKMTQAYVENDQYNISPCRDDKPYFYDFRKGASDEYVWLSCGVGALNLLAVWLPLRVVRRKYKKGQSGAVTLPLAILVCIGLGFMILEVSLFQKLVLYLGSPTVSLSILLSSLLAGMAVGSFWGKRLYQGNVRSMLHVISSLIVITGVLLFIACPYVLSKIVGLSLAVRSSASFLMFLPFGFLLGIPFPSCIQLLKQGNMEKYIPWMYGVNGAMSVLGSVLAVILSFVFGFSMAFFAGLSLYLIIFILLSFTSRESH